MRVEEAMSEAAVAGGVAWPVIIIGGLVILAGLVALRGEIGNFRERRAKR